MHDKFFKFPRTPHLSWPLDRPPKDDRVLDSASVEELLSANVIVEEKIDGANVGLSIGEHGNIRAQNRGSWLERGTHPQFHPLWNWISQRRSVLQKALGSDRILFGEWCFAVHSVKYDQLPDWYLGFDIYDLHYRNFWSTRRRNELLLSASIWPVPRLFVGKVTLSDLQSMLRSERSRVADGPIEGLYVRRDSADWLQARAKLVRPEFLLAIDEHWSSRSVVRNKLIAS
jgi:hypothetical protein